MLSNKNVPRQRRSAEKGSEQKPKNFHVVKKAERRKDGLKRTRRGGFNPGGKPKIDLTSCETGCTGWGKKGGGGD